MFLQKQSSNGQSYPQRDLVHFPCSTERLEKVTDHQNDEESFHTHVFRTQLL